jgi:hypothetical protein
MAERDRVTENASELCSQFLTFRHFLKNEGSATNDSAESQEGSAREQLLIVDSAREIGTQLEAMLRGQADNQNDVGLLLSGGIDSAILASYMPRGTPAITIQFKARATLDESHIARVYADECGLEHHVIEISWSDYLVLSPPLMTHKSAPLHPVEIALHKAAILARDLGIRKLVVGNGADTNFGGMDKLLSRDWSASEFQARYSFVEPATVLCNPTAQSHVFKRFERNGTFDTLRFLREIHGPGISEAFANAIASTGVELITPYERLALKSKLDIARIRGGEPKYLLNQLFKQRYATLAPPKKIPFARPMEEWLSEWSGPSSQMFREALDITMFSGEQRWLLFTLDQFLKDCYEAEG